MTDQPSFNLWSEAWITVERLSGALDILSLEQTLRDAHRIHTLYDSSPLVVAGIHRLLVAVLQASYVPRRTPDLVQIWREQETGFSSEKIVAFGAKYASRFDLFAQDAPFLQTADLHLKPTKEDNAKPIGYLLEDQPAGTAVTHYTHAYDQEQIFCSRCAAKGLLTMPAFASSGGAGIKPSINGVPPIYIFPGGQTLFHSLTGSLTAPGYQPSTSSPQDLPWWERPLPTIVEKKGEVRRVGYLHSLTFPARRIRLHPIHLPALCTRCGQHTTWGVQTMVYEMGESRPQTASWWRDPFAAYRKPKSEKEPPLPVRPVEGRALWREYAALFLPEKADEKGQKAIRPAIIEQLEDIWLLDKTTLPYSDFPLRSIGLRTDMKMKIFEWEEAGFAVPPRLLTDVDAAHRIRDGIEFAKSCDGIIKSTFGQYFSGGSKGARYDTLKQEMSHEYWQQLGQAFQEHIKQYGVDADVESLFHQWLDTVLSTANRIFQQTIDELPTTGSAPVPKNVPHYKEIKRGEIKMIRLREDALNDCRKFLYGFRKKHYARPMEETA